MGKPLLDVLKDLTSDPAEQATFSSDPEGYLARHGYGDMAADDLNDAVDLMADNLPTEMAMAIAPEAAGNGPGTVTDTLQRLAEASDQVQVADSDQTAEGAGTDLLAGDPEAVDADPIPEEGDLTRGFGEVDFDNGGGDMSEVSNTAQGGELGSAEDLDEISKVESAGLGRTEDLAEMSASGSGDVTTADPGDGNPVTDPDDVTTADPGDGNPVTDPDDGGEAMQFGAGDFGAGSAPSAGFDDPDTFGELMQEDLASGEPSLDGEVTGTTLDGEPAFTEPPPETDGFGEGTTSFAESDSFEAESFDHPDDGPGDDADIGAF